MTFSSYGCIGIGLIFYYRLVIVSFSIPYRLSSSQIEVVFFFWLVPEYSHIFLNDETSFVRVCGYLF